MTDGNEMSHEEKIDYMEIAANICKFMLTNEQMDLLVSIYELVLKKGGDADLRQISEINAEVFKRAELNKPIKTT